MTSRIEAQNDVIIALLARSSIGVDAIYRVVVKGKKRGSPEDFVRAYNALDGSKPAGEIAALVGITQQGMAQVLQTWEDEGIVYKVGSGNQVRYFALLKLPKSMHKGKFNKKDPGSVRRTT